MANGCTTNWWWRRRPNWSGSPTTWNGCSIFRQILASRVPFRHLYFKNAARIILFCAWTKQSTPCYQMSTISNNNHQPTMPFRKSSSILVTTFKCNLIKFRMSRQGSSRSLTVFVFAAIRWTVQLIIKRMSLTLVLWLWQHHLQYPRKIARKNILSSPNFAKYKRQSIKDY